MGIMVVAAALNLAIAAVPAAQVLPWVLALPPVIAFAVQLEFPVVQLLMLDCFPTMRGAAASGQSFVQLLFNAFLAGVISPVATTSLPMLAVASAVLAVLGACFWGLYRASLRNETKPV